MVGIGEQMLILHEYITDKREEEQLETWACLAEIRKKYTVVDRELNKFDNNSYDDFIAEYWGKDDFINIEMDNVVSLSQIDSMVNCSEPYCSYLYPCEYTYGLEVPTDAFGVTKINKSIQDMVPYTKWYRTGSWRTLDARIKNQVAQVLPAKQVVSGVLRGLCYKIHGMPFAHNHNDVNTLLKHNHPHRIGEIDPVTGTTDLLDSKILEETATPIGVKGELFDIIVKKVR
jgi:hypothetical protein